MHLTIEETKNGKPRLVYKNNKFRESYSTKNGEIVWRCLGRICTSSLRTDAERSNVISTHGRHSGPHPVTMSSLMSPPSTPCEPQSDCTSTPRSTEAAGPCDTHDATQKTPISFAPLTSKSPTQDLQIENSLLKEEISKLKQQVETILNHSIESDTRLLQFTNEVFVAKTSAAANSIEPELASITPAKSIMANIGVQCNLSVDCQDLRCADNRSLIQQLKTTIEVLEADLRCLRTEVGVCVSEREGDGWIVHTNKRRQSIITPNKFEVLSNNDAEIYQDKESSASAVHKKSKRRKKKEKKNYPPYKQTLTKSKKSKENDIFTPRNIRAINIESDSHGRGLARLVGNLMNPSIKVAGTVRPGAKLRSITSYSTPSPDSCVVLIAGTNDLAAGEEHCTIYRYIEQHILDKPTSSKLVVATLPYRHDLPTGHPIHRKTEYVNRHIKFITNKYKCRGVEALDFNRIPRHLFTNHGMHLRLPGKRLFARLVVDSVNRTDKVTSILLPSKPLSSPDSSVVAQPSITFSTPAGYISSDCATGSPADVIAVTPSKSSAPSSCPIDAALAENVISLPYETFADAVKKTPEQSCDTAVESVPFNKSSFLEIGQVKSIEH